MTKISAETWAGLRLGYLSGHGLRELARAAGIREGTVTARACRENWAALRKKGRDIIVPDPAAITPDETIQNVMAEHKEQFQRNTAKAIRNASRAAASLDDTAALESSRKLADLVAAGAKLHGLGGAETQVAISVLNEW